MVILQQEQVLHIASQLVILLQVIQRLHIAVLILLHLIQLLQHIPLQAIVPVAPFILVLEEDSIISIAMEIKPILEIR